MLLEIEARKAALPRVSDVKAMIRTVPVNW